MVWKGISGTRKTSALRDFPGPMFILDTDQRVDPLITLASGRTDIEVESFTPYEWKKFDEAFGKLERQQDQFRTVVLDSYTSLARMCVHYARLARGGSHDKKYGDINTNTLEDYNAEANGCGQVIDRLLSLSNPQFVIIICHIQGTEYDPAGKPIGRTILTGGKKLSAALPIPFNHIFHFESKPGLTDDASKWEVITQNVGLDFARTTLPLQRTLDIGTKSLYSQINEACQATGIDIEKSWK